MGERTIDRWIEDLRDFRDSAERHEKISMFEFARRRAQQFAEQRAADTPHYVDTPTGRNPNMGTWHPINEQPVSSPTGQPFNLVPHSLRLEKSPLEDEYRKKHGNAWEKELGRTLITEWQNTRNPDTLEHIYALYEPLLERTINNYARRRLPEPAVRARTYNTFLSSVEKYDPSSQQEFHNFFTNWGARGGTAVSGGEGTGLNRWADRYSNFAAVNWQRGSKLNKVRLIQSQFELEHGRQATAAELIEKTGWKPREVSKLVKELRGDHISSRNITGEGGLDERAMHTMAWERVRDGLPVDERKIMDDLVEYMDADKAMGQRELASRHGISEQKLSRFKKKLRTQLQTELERQQRFT